MSWEYDIAEKIKTSGRTAREKAVEEASGYIGTIEQLSPLKISIMDGEAYYEGPEEIYQSRTFCEYGSDVKKVGAEVIIVPIDGIDLIAVIDVVKGG